MGVQLIDDVWYYDDIAVAYADDSPVELEELAHEYDLFAGIDGSEPSGRFRAVADAMRRRQKIIDNRNAAQAALNEPPNYCISGDCLGTNMDGMDRLHFRQITCPPYDSNELYVHIALADALLS